MTTGGDLASKKCVPCRGGLSPLTPDQIAPLAPQVPAWQVVRHHHLHRALKTKNFDESLELTNRIGRLAEEEGHHPDLTVGWGYLEIDLWTHKIDGLSESDFILASKIDRILTP